VWLSKLAKALAFRTVSDSYFWKARNSQMTGWSLWQIRNVLRKLRVRPSINVIRIEAARQVRRESEEGRGGNAWKRRLCKRKAIIMVIRLGDTPISIASCPWALEFLFPDWACLIVKG